MDKLVGERKTSWLPHKVRAATFMLMSLVLVACSKNEYPPGVSVQTLAPAATPREMPGEGEARSYLWCDAIFVSAAGAVIKPIVSFQHGELLPDDIRIQQDFIRHGRPQDPGTYQWYVKGRVVKPKQIEAHCSAETVTINKVPFTHPTEVKLAYTRTGYLDGGIVSQDPMVLASPDSFVLHQPVSSDKLGLDPILSTG